MGASVHVFDLSNGKWTEEIPSGIRPPGLYRSACASAGHHLYFYGGFDGLDYTSSLYQLDTEKLAWAQLNTTFDSGPMKKGECAMLNYNSNMVLFGGCCKLSSTCQPGAEFVKNKEFGDGRGWINELHTLDVDDGEYTKKINSYT